MICVINREHIEEEEEEALKYQLNLTLEKAWMTLVRLILAVIAFNCTEVG